MSALRKDLRHRARETALQILYAWDIGHTDIDQAVHTFFTYQWVGEGPSDDLRQFATELARETVVAWMRSIRSSPKPQSGGVPTMAVLDRLILRMAVCELLRKGGRPPPVSSRSARARADVQH